MRFRRNVINNFCHFELMHKSSNWSSKYYANPFVFACIVCSAHRWSKSWLEKYFFTYSLNIPASSFHIPSAVVNCCNVLQDLFSAFPITSHYASHADRKTFRHKKARHSDSPLDTQQPFSRVSAVLTSCLLVFKKVCYVFESWLVLNNCLNLTNGFHRVFDLITFF